MSDLATLHARDVAARAEYHAALAALRAEIDAETLAMRPSRPAQVVDAWPVVLRVVAEHTGIPAERFLDRSAGRALSLLTARWLAHWAARELAGMAFTEVARRANVDHGTVMHACRKITERLKVDRTFARQVDRLRVAVELALATPAEDRAAALILF